MTSKYVSVPGYRSWTSMRQRCSNPNHPNYLRYGGRGISVCPEWDCFEKFMRDMGARPKGGSIDRIDTNGDYTPDNCKWSSAAEQSRNRNPRGTFRKPRRADHSGKRYNNLVMTSFSHKDGDRMFWRAKCDCGAEAIVNVRQCVRGYTKSCGCVYRSRFG